MNYQTFEEIVGPQLIRKMKNSIVGKSIEAKKLYEIYKHLTLNAKHDYTTHEVMLNQETTDLDEDITNLEQTLEINESITKEDASDGAFPKVVSDIAEHENTIEIKTAESEESNSPCILSLTNALTVPEPIQTVEIISEHQTGNEPFCIPSTSRQNVEFIGGEWVLVDVSESPKKKFKDFLPLPKTPIKKQKLGAQPQNRTFVLTSKDWEDAEMEKQQKKLDIIQQKEAKRKARLEKAELNRSTKIKKQINNQNKKKGKIENRSKKNGAKSSKITILSNILLKSSNTTNLESDKGNIEKEKHEVTINNQPITDKDEQIRQPLSTIFRENKGFTTNEELIEKIESQNINIEQEKPKQRTSTKGRENKKSFRNKDRSNNVPEKSKRHGGPTKPLSNEDLLRILEED